MLYCHVVQKFSGNKPPYPWGTTGYVLSSPQCVLQAVISQCRPRTTKPDQLRCCGGPGQPGPAIFNSS